MLRFVPGVVQFQSVCFVMAGVEMHINPGLGIDDHWHSSFVTLMKWMWLSAGFGMLLSGRGIFEIILYYEPSE